MKPDPIVPVSDPVEAHHVPAQTVLEFEPGAFVENLVVRSDRTVFGTIHPTGEIWRWHADTGRQKFVTLPVPVAGITYDANGFLFVSAGTPGKGKGSIWRISPSGEAKMWVEIDGSLFLNGITPARNGQSLYVVDSICGRVFEIDALQPRQQIWLEDERLKPRSDESVFPGANGIKFFGRSVLISNTDRATLLRATIHPDGRGGPLQVVAERLLADDFAFDVHGDAYLATHSYNSVVRLAADGTRAELGNASHGLSGATAVAFMKDWVYVTTETAMASPVDGQLPAARLVRLEVGQEGYSLLD